MSGPKFPVGPPRLNKTSDQARGLVAWYPLAGDLFDRAGRGYNLNNVGSAAASFNASELGLATLYAANVETYVEAAPVTAEPCTISAWVRLDSDTAANKIVCQIGQTSGSLNRIVLLVTDAEIASFGVADGAGTQTADGGTLTVGKWHHIVGVAKSATSRQIYLDGTLRGSNSNSKTPTAPARTIVGEASNLPGQQFPGLIKDVRVYNYALTADQIFCLYDAESRWDLWRPPEFVWVVDIPSPVDVSVPLGSVTAAGQVPAVASGASVAVPVGSVAAAGLVPTVATGVSVAVGLGTVTAAGLAPAIYTGASVAVPVGSATIQGYAPSSMAAVGDLVVVPSRRGSGIAGRPRPPYSLNMASPFARFVKLAAVVQGDRIYDLVSKRFAVNAGAVDRAIIPRDGGQFAIRNDVGTDSGVYAILEDHEIVLPANQGACIWAWFSTTDSFGPIFTGRNIDVQNAICSLHIGFTGGGGKSGGELQALVRDDDAGGTLSTFISTPDSSFDDTPETSHLAVLERYNPADPGAWALYVDGRLVQAKATDLSRSGQITLRDWGWLTDAKWVDLGSQTSQHRYLKGRVGLSGVIVGGATGTAGHYTRYLWDASTRYDLYSRSALRIMGGETATMVDIAAPLGTLTIAGQLPSIAAGAGVAVPLGTLAAAGLIPAVAAGASVAVPAGSVAAQGLVPDIVTSTVVNVPAGAVAATGELPAIYTGASAAVPLGTLAAAGLVPSIVTGASASVPLGTLAATGLVPSVVTGFAVLVPTGTIAAAGLVPSVGSGVKAAVPLGTLAATGYAPAVGAGALLEVPLGTLTIAGQLPTIDTGFAVQILVPKGTAAIAGQVPTAQTGVNVASPLGSAAILGIVPSISTGEIIKVPIASLAAAGKLPSIATGAVAVPTPGLEYAGKPSRLHYSAPVSPLHYSAIDEP